MSSPRPAKKVIAAILAVLPRIEKYKIVRDRLEHLADSNMFYRDPADVFAEIADILGAYLATTEPCAMYIRRIMRAEVDYEQVLRDASGWRAPERLPDRKRVRFANDLESTTDD